LKYYTKSFFSKQIPRDRVILEYIMLNDTGMLQFRSDNSFPLTISKPIIHIGFI
jgi:hypothetical protein